VVLASLDIAAVSGAAPAVAVTAPALVVVVAPAAAAAAAASAHVADSMPAAVAAFPGPAGTPFVFSVPTAAVLSKVFVAAAAAAAVLPVWPAPVLVVAAVVSEAM